MNKYSNEFNAVQQYASIVHEYLPNTKVYLFGSYAKDCPKETSDIDVGIISNDISYLGKDRYLEVLNKLMVDAYDVDTRIEPHLVSKKHDRADFSGVIEHTGVQIA